MRYPKEFVAKVKAEFPDWTELHKKLDEGNAFVGRYLDDNSNFDMKAADIVKAFNEGRQDEVKKAAEQCVRRQELYAEWGEIAKYQM